MELDLATAQAICVTLRGVSDRLRDTLAKKLKSQIAEGGHRSLDRSGASIQAEALQLGLLMHGMPGTPAETLLAALRRHDADARVASFLQHWTQLALVAGVCAPGSGDAVATSFVDWYRGPPGQARYAPPSLSALRADLEAFVLQGWTPESPLVGRGGDELVTALGSCFADEVRLWLRARGYAVNDDFRSGASYPHVEDSTVPVLQCSAGLVNTFVLRQQFEWALEGKNFDDDLWVGARGTMVLPTEAARRRTREMFERTSLFVVTLGLAEVWYQRRSADGDDGAAEEEQVLWRAVPSDRHDPKRHGFRVSSVAENLDNLRAIVRLVRAHCAPSASIVFTLSPVPLAATFRGVACVTANAVSKSVLRVAVDELLRENGVGYGSSAKAERSKLYYWPAYEIIKEGFADPYLEDGRHPKPEIVQEVLRIFGKYYCAGSDDADGSSP